MSKVLHLRMQKEKREKVSELDWLGSEQNPASQTEAELSPTPWKER